MNVKYMSNDKRMQVELDGDMKTIFKDLSAFQEVFENLKCGKCGDTNIRFLVRQATDGKKKYDYYELRCTKCHARFKYGQSEDTVSLFPKRKDENGNWLPDGGWTKWDKEKEEEV